MEIRIAVDSHKNVFPYLAFLEMQCLEFGPVMATKMPKRIRNIFMAAHASSRPA